MVIKQFPPVEASDEQGLLAIGGDLEIESLLLAYRSGIFPWPLNEKILAWFSPPRRAILRLANFRIPISLKKALKKAGFTNRFDADFPAVINHCAAAKNRKGQRGTWITDELISAYIALNGAGIAHSVETYLDEQLVGGLYGVSIESFFAGESMFYLESNASKAALVTLMQHLEQHGVEWIDCQVMTPHLKQLGAEEIERDEYLDLLANALSRPAKPFADIKNPG
ncbi:MAG: leucyl/phenylalanyl-tRNA--protein transferase [Deltaproteobacteria bacterium]|nr:leucyl/phenylalanyl-tRNA--protein transferase [Deltaproteobacteria bacterium]